MILLDNGITDDINGAGFLSNETNKKALGIDRRIELILRRIYRFEWTQVPLEVHEKYLNLIDLLEKVSVWFFSCNRRS
jgi:hypothetical protein